MLLRSVALVCVVLALGSIAVAQDDPRNKMLIEQQLRMQQLQQNGQLTEAQKQALQMRMLQTLRGQKQGPKTGVYPGMPIQGNGMMPMQGNGMMPVQGNMNGAAGVAAQNQAQRNRAEQKKKADAKKAKGDKKEKKEKPAGDKK